VLYHGLRVWFKDQSIKINGLPVMIILNNHYMLVGKYIFVIFLNRFVKANFRGMGVGSGAKAPSILKFDIFLPNFLQKFCFLSFEW